MSLTFLSIVFLQAIPYLWFRNSLERVAFTVIAWSSLAVLQGFFGAFWEEIPSIYTTLVLNLLLLLFTIYLLRNNGARSVKVRLASITSFALLIFLFQETVNYLGLKRILQILTWGYDNAGSLSLIIQVDACNTYLNNCKEVISDTFPMSLSDYPQNYALSITSFLPGSFSNSLESIVFGYFSIYASSILLLSLVCISFVLRSTNRPNWVMVIFLPLLVLFGYWSHIFGSGFLSFILGSAIFFAGTIVVDFALKRDMRQGVIAFAIVCVNLWLTYQLLALPLLLALVGVIWKQYSGVAITGKLRIVALIIAASGASTLFILRSDPSVQGLSYTERILTDGGIQPIPLPLFLISTVFGLIFAIKVRNKLGEFVTLNYVSTVLLATSLAIYSFSEKSYISYYPMKFMYLSMLYSLLFAITAIASTNKLFPNRNLNLTARVSTIVLLCYSIYLSSPSGYPFSSVMMGSSYGYAKGVIDGVSNNRGMACSTAIIQGFEEKSKTSADLVLVVDQNGFNELDTRWINVLSRTWNDDTFSLELSAARNRNNLDSAISFAGESILVVEKSDFVFSQFSTVKPNYEIKANC